MLCVPAVPLATEAARQVLPASVPHADAAKNAARAALLVAALTGGTELKDAALLLDATQDFLHQPYRASSMPATASLIGALRDAGIPAVVSGAGPAALALIVSGVTAGPEAVAAIAAESGARLDRQRPRGRPRRRNRPLLTPAPHRTPGPGASRVRHRASDIGRQAKGRRW